MFNEKSVSTNYGKDVKDVLTGKPEGIIGAIALSVAVVGTFAIKAIRDMMKDQGSHYC